MQQASELDRVKELLVESGQAVPDDLDGMSLEDLWNRVVPDALNAAREIDVLMRGESSGVGPAAVRNRRKLCPECGGLAWADHGLRCPSCNGARFLDWLMTGAGFCTICKKEAGAVWFMFDPAVDGRCSSCHHDSAIRNTRGSALPHSLARARRELLFVGALLEGLDAAELAARYAMSARVVARRPEFVAARQVLEFVRNATIVTSEDPLGARWAISDRQKRKIRATGLGPVRPGVEAFMGHLRRASDERAEQLCTLVLASAMRRYGWWGCCEECAQAGAAEL